MSLNGPEKQMSKLNDWVNGLKKLSRDEIIDRLGADNWADVVISFDGMSLGDIRSELTNMFPHEPEANDELAQAVVYEFLNGAWVLSDPSKTDASIAAVTLGSKGGSVTSEAKAAAARENGRKGGRPKKK
jgi:hypothetical protein